MRTYIFTEFERKRLAEFFDGRTDKPVRNILSRIRLTDVLRRDVELYLRTDKAMKTV